MFEFFTKKTEFYEEAEKILYMKNMSKETKNVILDTITMIDDNYNSYQKVLQEVMTKIDFNGRILNILKHLKYAEVKNDSGSAYCDVKVDKENSSITFRNDPVSCMFALMNLEPRYFRTPGYPYSSVLKRMLNDGTIDMEVELVRDFSELSWKKQKSCSATYQDIILRFNFFWLYGKEAMRNLILNQDEFDVYSMSKKIISDRIKIDTEGKYYTEYVNALSNLLYANATKEEKEDIKKVYEKDIATLNLMQDSKEYLKKLEEEKKKISEIIANIDKIMNNQELLFEAFAVKKRELLEKDSEKNADFDINMYKNVLEESREGCVRSIDNYTKIQSPEVFLETKKVLEEKIGFMLTETRIEDALRRFQKAVYEMFYESAANIPDDDILYHIYMVRYSRFNYYEDGMQGIDYPDIYQKADKLLRILVKRGVEAGIITKFADDDSANNAILLPAFKTNIVDFGDIRLSVYKTDTLLLRIYDGNVLRNEFQLLDVSPASVVTGSRKKVKILTGK